MEGFGACGVDEEGAGEGEGGFEGWVEVVAEMKVNFFFESFLNG